MVKFGTTKLCQVLPWNFRHLFGCHGGCICGVCLFLSQNLAIVYQFLPWHLRICAKFSPHRIFPFQILCVTTPPPPPLVCLKIEKQLVIGGA